MADGDWLFQCSDGNVFLPGNGDLHGLFCICQDAGSRPTPLTTPAHTYKEVSLCTVHSSQPPQSWAGSKAAPVPSPSLPRRVLVTRLCGQEHTLQNVLQQRQPQSRTGSARGVRGVLTFQEATGRHAQQGLLNDIMFPFCASPLVGLWYVKLHPCGASGNLNTALGSSTIAWLGEAGIALPTVQAVTHSILLDRMAWGCRVREDLVMQNHSTLLSTYKFHFPQKGHQVPSNKEPS